MLRLWIKYTAFAGGRKWYTPVTSADGAYSALEEARIPTTDDMEKGVIFREISDFGLQVKRIGSIRWEEWSGKEGEDFKEFCADRAIWVAQEQAVEGEGEADDYYP